MHAEALGEDAYRHGYEVIRGRLATAGEEIEMLPLLFANAPTVSGELIDRGMETLRADPRARQRGDGVAIQHVEPAAGPAAHTRRDARPVRPL